VAHRAVEGDGLRTIYAFAPRAVISTERNGPTTFRLSFASSPIYSDDDDARTTLLTFEHVVEYEFNDFEFHRYSSNPQDVDFGLIEILGSQIVAKIRSTGRYIGDDLRHFRICFDDHGTYDVVCEQLRISYGRSSPAELHG
jgi:hypothetical protein